MRLRRLDEYAIHVKDDPKSFVHASILDDRRKTCYTSSKRCVQSHTPMSKGGLLFLFVFTALMTSRSDAARDDGPSRLAIEDSGAAASLADGVRVHVASGVVTLQGHVPSPEARTQVVSAIQELQGVVSVQDRLVVGPSAASDERLAELAVQRLSQLPAIPRETVQIDVRDGVAHISGTTESAASKAAYQRMAERMTGVRRVENSLRVQASR
jgi:osmotically-inducible protein OsmY